MPSDIRRVLAAHIEPDRLPVLPPDVWADLKVAHPDLGEIYADLADHIHDNGVPFPRTETRDADAENAFRELRATSWDKVLFHPRDARGQEYVARQAYRSWTAERMIGVIGLGAAWNVVSDHFQWRNRLRCSGWSAKSPLAIWESRDDLRKMDWGFDELGEPKGMIRSNYLAALRLRTYTATQFKPHVQHAMIGWLGAKSVLDFSCGWGDRLAGFYVSPAVSYVGCDPNRAVWETYERQVVAYEAWLGWARKPVIRPVVVDGYDAIEVVGHKRVVLVNGPAEDIDWSRFGPVDLAFTSPPFFRVERYALEQGPTASATQSWSRYPTFEAWRDRFLFPVVDRVRGVVAENGALALNLADPTIGSTRHRACDPLVNRLVTAGMTYAGLIAMALKKRPSMRSEDKGTGVVASLFAEPIWVFTRGRNLPRVTLDVFDLFGEAEKVAPAPLVVAHRRSVLDVPILPVEKVNERLWLKRDDLYRPFGEDHPMNGSKVYQCLSLLRGCISEIREEFEGTVYSENYLDSPQGPIVAYLCRSLGLRCIIPVGAGSLDHALRHRSMQLVREYGGEIDVVCRMPAGPVLKSKAKKKYGDRFFHVAFGMNSLDADLADLVLGPVAAQVDAFRGLDTEKMTLVVPTGSGVVFSGLLLGLARTGFKFRRVVSVQIAGRDRSADIAAMTAGVDVPAYEHVVDKTYNYNVLRPGTKLGDIVLDSQYEAKAWEWVQRELPPDEPVMLYLAANANWSRQSER